MPAAQVSCAGLTSSRVQGEAFLQLLRKAPQPRLCTVPRAMAPRQLDLRACWHTAAPGRLSAWQQAFACGLREASKELYGGHVAVTWIASKLRKTDATGKAYSQDAPEQGSLSEFFRKIDADPDWFPGKHCGRKRGPQPLLTKKKRARIAQSSMRQKEEGHEPSVEVTVARNRAATLNPKTGLPFCDKTIRKVWLTVCYDFDPEHPWKFQRPLQKRFLPEDIKQHRLRMANTMLDRMDHVWDASWWLRNVVWIDPCASLIPKTRRQYDRMRRAELGNRKRLISDNARQYNRNLRGTPEVLKQASYDVHRVNWLMVLTQGKVAVHMLPESWSVCGEGMAHAATMLPQVLQSMLGPHARLPRVLFTDRGTGMYAPSGRIVHAFNQAVRQQGFRTFWGEDASRQAPDMPDLLLHETAVSWFRSQMRRMKPAVHPWEETRSQWLARATRSVKNINATHDVAGLCREFTVRLEMCREGGGERLPK